MWLIKMRFSLTLEYFIAKLQNTFFIIFLMTHWMKQWWMLFRAFRLMRYPRTNPGLVSAFGCLCPIFNKQYANKKPQQQADFYDINLAGGSTKHIERRHQPSALMEKIQPSQNQSTASCSSSMANAGSRQTNKDQLQDVQGNILNRF